MLAPFFNNSGIIVKLDESLISSVFALKVTPKNVIFLFLILFFNIRLTRLIKNLFLFSFDLITLLITDKLVLYSLAVATIAFVSFGKHDPPYAGPALKKRLPILLSKPIAIATSSTLTLIFSHKLAISLIKVIFVAKKAFEAYLINSADLLAVCTYCAPFEIKGEYNSFRILLALLSSVPITIRSG